MAKSTAKNRETVLVTGASSGIGEALAKRFDAGGFDLVLVARSADKLRKLADELSAQHGIRAWAEPADLSGPEGAKVLAAKLARRKLPIDILVNNAGINEQGAFVKMPAERSQQIIAVNVAASTAMLSNFVPPMVRRGRGRVLNICSTSSFLPVPAMATNAATKAYLLSLTESLSEELKDSGVTMTALCPGATETPMKDVIDQANPKFSRLIGPTVSNVDGVAEEGFDACLRGEVIRVPGAVNLLTALSSRAAPKWLVRRVIGIVGRKSL